MPHLLQVDMYPVFHFSPKWSGLILEVFILLSIIMFSVEVILSCWFQFNQCSGFNAVFCLIQLTVLIPR